MFKVLFTVRATQTLARSLAAALFGTLLIAPAATMAASAPDVVVLQTSALHSLSRNRFEPPRVPSVLSQDDIDRYQRIFALQEDGDWGKADREIKSLQSDVLMGHVLYQRYMHPTAYRSKYSELRDWLAAYADHPGANRIYSLALRRKPAKASGPKAPSGPRASYGYADAPDGVAYRSPRKRSKVAWQEVRRIQAQIKNNVRRDRLTASEKLLDRESVKAALDQVERDALATRIATGWFLYGDDDKALKIAGEAAARSRRHLSSPDWFAGLAAWRLGRMELAQRHFTALAESKVAGNWTRAAGAFWAARAYLAGGKPERVLPMLQLASTMPRTFYGLIASRQLGKELDLQWAPPPLSEAGMASLQENGAVRRVIALTEIGRRNLAETELRSIYLTGSSEQGESLLALSYRLGLPAMQLRLARGVVSSDNRPYDQALFPVPPWRPEEGFAIDQALIFAFIRQESGFNAKAKSHVGARGLMQLMPRTASYVAGDRSLRHSDRNRLFDPEFNVELGQKYVDHLLKTDIVNGDLFKLAVAYNAGPGNLSKWLKRIRHNDDPLLFIESLPSRETRIFVERVLSNFWIYRERLGQDTPSLDAVATGHWPVYLSLDNAGYRMADNARN